VGSWRRNHDDYRGVAAASRAPIFAVVEDRWGRDPEARTQRLELLDASKWVVVGTRWPKLGQIDELVLSARGTSVAWALEDDPIVTLESVEGGGGWLQLHANSNDVEAIAISDDDTRLAVANRHVERNVFVGTVGSEDVETITTPRGVTHLSFSPDGTRLYVADFDGRVHVVDLGRAEVIATLEPGLQSINAMAVTADGTRLVVAYQEVVVLEIATGAEVRRFGGAPAMDYLRSVAVSEDGTVIVAGTASGVVRRFELR
jgi:DNA-binding beta-propeller fold protein YncE